MTWNMEASEDLWEFLRKRGVTEENIQKMQQDKIDMAIVHEIEDSYLSRYIPAYGDRIATRRYCLDKQKVKRDSGPKVSLLEKLQKKMKTASASFGEQSQPKCGHNNPSKNALKSTRKIEMGWLHEGKQVRKRTGGGTRILSVPKDSTREDLIKHAKDLFFPNGESKIGQWEDFVHDVYDFKEALIDTGTTVGHLYTLHKFGILRFYLSTKYIKDVALSATDVENEVSEADHFGELQTESDNYDEKQTNASKKLCGTTDYVEEACSDHPEMETIDLTFQADDSEVFIGGLGQTTSQTDDLDDTLPVLMAQSSEPTLTSSPVNPIHEFQPIPVQLNESVPLFHLLPISEAPLSPSPISNTVVGYDKITIVLEVHRVNLLSELISHFKDEVIMSYRLKYRFIDEMGADADGVARDVYAAFWGEFVDSAAEGADMRIPFLTPKWQEEEWRAIGRIFAKGFIDQDYFPLRLASAFTTALIFGEHAVSTDLLFESLLLYLGRCDRDLVTTALKEQIDSDGQDELIDLLDRLGVTVVPTQDNLKAVLLQAAHKLFIQKPKYALDNMSSVSVSLLSIKIKTPKDIQSLYENKKPTCRKVLKLIEANPETPAENQSFRYLQQYIRELDEVGLRHILRFVTGSDIISVAKIHVTFTVLEGLSRRPVAHTCGALLELPSTYNSFPELRVEMDNVLNNNYYVMDII